jgi:hypothetical protein
LACIRRDSSATETDVKTLIDFVNASDCIAHELKAHLVQLLSQQLDERT